MRSGGEGGKREDDVMLVVGALGTPVQLEPLYTPLKQWCHLYSLRTQSVILIKKKKVDSFLFCDVMAIS